MSKDNMVRFPLRRYAYSAVPAAVVLLAMAIYYAEDLRARHWYRGSLGYYQNILKRDPGNLDAIKTLASLYYDLRRFKESKEYYNRAIKADPDDPELYYSIAVIDWSEAYQMRSEAKGKLGLPADGGLNDRKECEDLKIRTSAGISEGMDMLLRVFELNPDYKNAAFYMGMLWHEKAYIECGDTAAIRSDLKKAEQWMNRKKSAPAPGYDDSKRAKLLVAGVSHGTRMAEPEHRNRNS